MVLLVIKQPYGDYISLYEFLGNYHTTVNPYSHDWYKCNHPFIIYLKKHIYNVYTREKKVPIQSIYNS